MSDDVHIEPTSGCWLWAGDTERVDVALSNVRRKTYSDEHGRPQAGMCPRPSCGSYWCVNPRHMVLSAPKTKADRQKKWEAKNQEHRAGYLKQYAQSNAERINEQQAKRTTSRIGWIRILRAVVSAAIYTVIDDSPLGLVPDQWIADGLGISIGYVTPHRRRRRIPTASLTVYETCARCLEPFSYQIGQGGKQVSCDDCARHRSAGGKARAHVLLRDGGVCRYCNAQCSDAFEVDHIVPWSAGGWNAMVNYALACVPCNHGKSAVRLDVNTEWRMIHDNLERMTRRA